MIDLIIPAYNAEETIGRALGSVVAQTRQRKCIVTVVDDCSTDATAAIVQKFKGLLNINYIKLDKNLGKPGLVRNEGIKRTSCPYIMFLDADDILAPNALEVFSRITLQKKPDFVSAKFYQDNRSDKYSLITSLTWLHGKLYKREFLKNNNIMFDDKFNEDGSFNMKCYWLADNKMIIDTPLYYWMDNKDSLTRKDNNFMANIGYDYVTTYTDAIEFILNKNNNLIKNIKFKNQCARKLAEFIHFKDELLYQESNECGKVHKKIKEYINLMNKYNMIDKSFLIITNRHFNQANIFMDTVRQLTLIEHLSDYNINLERELK